MRRKRRQKGTGGVIPRKAKNGDTTFYVQFYDADKNRIKEHAGKVEVSDPDGVFPRQSKGRESEGWTPSLAERYLRARIGAVETKRWTRPTPTVFGPYADDWLERQTPLRAWDTGTVRSYRNGVTRLQRRFGNTKLADIRRSHINAFVPELREQYEASTVSLTLTVLRQILDLAVEDELIPSNPAEKIKRPKIERYKPPPLRPEELARVEAAIADPQCRFAFQMFSRLGIRFIELRGIRWKDVEMQARRVRIEDSKTEAGERWLAIPQRLAEAFKDHYARSPYNHETNYVFCHPHTGSKWHERYFRRAMKEALASAGIEGRFRPAHDLRVSSITNGVLVGEHPSKLMQRAGHTNYDTTRGYIQLAGEVFLDDADALEAHLVGAAQNAQEATEALQE